MSASTFAQRRPGLDWVLLLAVLALVALGSLLVWSATSHRDDLTDAATPTAYLQQAGRQHRASGWCCSSVVTATDHRWVRILAPLVYLASVGGLVLVLTNGSTINGSRSWIQLGGMSVQPSEFAKLAVVIGMALLVAERTEGRRGPLGLGTVDVGMLVIAGDPRVADPAPAGPRHHAGAVGDRLRRARRGRDAAALAGRCCVAGGVTAAVAMVAGGLLKAYQVDRFLAFTNPDLDPRGAGYNTEQARIAVGNGGLFGQGLFDGSQTQSGFVPEQHTDFVFTVAGEELGLLGAGLLIALLVRRDLAGADDRRDDADDVFGRVAAAGIACWFGFQTFQNVGMCLGIMPVTGVPLPFVSYGGSSLFAGMLAVGLLQNIPPARTSSPAGRRRSPSGWPRASDARQRLRCVQEDVRRQDREVEAAHQRLRPARHHREHAHDHRQEQQHHLGLAEAERQRSVEPDRGDRDGGDGQADAGHRGPVGEVQADLDPAAAGRPDRRDRLRAAARAARSRRRRRRAGKPTAATTSSIDGRLDLGQPDHRDQGDHEQRRR